MREFQKCQKCGKVYAQIDRTGPSIGGMGDIMRHAGKTICPSCLGPVIWVDDRGSPMSADMRTGYSQAKEEFSTDIERAKHEYHERMRSIPMDEADRHLRLGCLWGIVALIGFLILYHFVMK